METKPSEREGPVLTEKGKAVLALYQSAREATSESDQIRRLQQFSLSLVQLIDPVNPKYEPNVGKELIGVLTKGGILYIDAGSSGDRIYFRDHRYADGGRVEESPDGKVRWMAYPARSCVFPHQKDILEKFLANFGGEEIDLMQKLE